MGQLKSGIATLQKLLVEMEPKLKAAEQIVDDEGARIGELSRKTDQGYDVLYLYLTEKLKKSNSTPDAHARDTLKSFNDPKIPTLIKGIVQWKGDLKTAIAGMNQKVKNAKDDLLNKLISAETQALTLEKLAEKKKDKLFKSAKYKTKIKTYLVALDTVLKILKTQIAEVKASGASNITDDWVEREFPISPDMTVAQLKARTSMDLKQALKLYAQNKAQIDQHVRKWRVTYKAIPLQLANLKKWSEEADEMESEG